MKHLLIIIFLFLVTAQAFAQIDPEKALYLQKVEKYHRMKRTGTTLTIAGTVLSVVGFITLLNSSVTTTYNGSYSQTTTEGNFGAGLAAYLGGTVCVGVGVPLWIVGGVNEGRYQRKLDALTVGANVSPRQAGLTLRYRF